MKVAMLGAYPVYGFAEELGIDPRAFQRVTSWNETLAGALAERDDVEVHFITGTKVIPRTRTVQRGQLKVTYFVSPPRMNMLTLFQYTRWQVHRLLQEIEPDVVHGIGTEHIWPYVAVTSHFPSIVTVHGVMTEIVRKVPPSFSWVDHRFITHGLIAELYPLEILLYVFLIIVGDRYGLSYYGDEKICRLLKIDKPSLCILRKKLILKSFIGYKRGVYHVLALNRDKYLD